jgi:hypothetical protein
MAAGAVWSLVAFVIGLPFLIPAFQYPISQALIAVVSSLIGGGVAAYIYQRILERHWQ